MSGFETAEFADQAGAQQIQVANRIEDLVLDELVFITQAIFVEYMIFVDHDRVLHTAPKRQIVRAEKLDVAHEPEGPRTADFLDEGSAGEIHGGSLSASAEDRMVEIDLETHLEAVERKEGSPLVPILHRDLADDADEFLVGVLLFQPR